MNTIKEPILCDENQRFVLFPIQHKDIWLFYKKAEAGFWTCDDVDISNDLYDWNHKLEEHERQFIKRILAFFATSDSIVNENLVANFLSEVKYPEAKSFYGFQIAIENIHSETFSLLIDTYIEDATEKQKLFNAMDTLEFVHKKIKWAMRWIGHGTFAQRIISLAAIEGIFFSSSFCSIFWLKQRNILPGLTFYNQLISRDEELHCDFACLIYKNHLVNKLSEQEVFSIISEAVALEKEFVADVLLVDMIGLSNSLMQKYIEFVADRLLIELGYRAHYHTSNPFDFMQLTKVDNHKNSH